MKKALLVVDVQNDFCPGGALAVPNGDKVIEPLNRMIRHGWSNGWVLVASRDWHPRQTTHFSGFGGKWPVHCVKGTYGARFHQLLVNNGLEYHFLVFNKGTTSNEDGYSPFEGKNVVNQLLEEYLRENNASELYIGGLATDYCVKAAAIDAVKKGFKTYLLRDACRAVNVNDPNSPNRNTPLAKEVIKTLRAGSAEPTDETIAIEEMRRAGVIFTTVEDTISRERQ